MDLVDRFEQYIQAHQLCEKENDRVLVAVSGGKDSVLLLHLFVEAGYQVGIAHCNFQLRSPDADLDQQLVEEMAARLQVPCFVSRFDTQAYAQSQKISTQMAARELRYDWFEHLCTEQNYSRIAIAHHASDQVETLLINLLRGTGLKGFCGIPVKRDRIIRPLLFLSAAEIADSVERKSLAYRDDLSNFSTDYLRNKLRLDIIPMLNSLNPRLEQTVFQEINAMRDVSRFLDIQVEELRKKLFFEEKDGLRIDLNLLKNLEPLHLLVYELLKAYNFTASVCYDLVRTLASEQSTPAGLYFESSTHQLRIDRDTAWLTSLELTQASRSIVSVELLDQQHCQADWKDQRIEMNIVPISQYVPRPDQVAFDADLVTLPLQVRSRQTGDRFRPQGMQGRQKKISDFFISQKIPVWKKDSIPLVVDALGGIIWVAPLRMSALYNISDKTKIVLTLSYFCKDGR